jgi:hypothetical protein
MLRVDLAAIMVMQLFISPVLGPMVTPRTVVDMGKR